MLANLPITTNDLLVMAGTMAAFILLSLFVFGRRKG